MDFYIEVPSKYFGVTKGFCGNNNGNKDDDHIDENGKKKWLTRSGMIATVEYTNEWK